VFEHIPLVDNHAHPWLRTPDEPYSRFFTEGPRPQPHTLFYRHALRDLADFLGCPADESAVLAARQKPGFVRRLVQDVRLETVLVDDGYPREGGVSLAEMAEAAGFRVRRVLRLERLAEDLIGEHRDLGEFTSAFVASLDAARPELAAVKSVIAYRSGLEINPPDDAQAAEVLARVAPGRLTSKPLLEYLLGVAVDWCATHDLPLHLHTGFGDRDLDLRLANPLHLRPLLESGRLERSPLVLLHASYPYTREAAYLASVHPNVYVDLSLVSPLLAGPALMHVFQDLLGLAPVTRLLYGSDAWGIPDWLWLAARSTRRALEHSLTWLPAAEAEWAAQRILHANASELYGLP
jgi:predicted TIM-barrel fold metal-dependent hydrolase